MGRECCTLTFNVSNVWISRAPEFGQTPCMVGLGSKERALGQAAIAKINSNIKVNGESMTALGF